MAASALVNIKGSVSQSAKSLRAHMFKMLRTAKALRPSEALKTCGNCLHFLGQQQRSRSAKLMVTGSGANKRAFLGGVNQCGRIWDCPVCASRIAGQRREEVAGAIEGAEAAEDLIYMVALTIPHGKFDYIKPLRQSVSESFRKTQSGVAWMRIKQAAGFIGSIRAMEVTHGRNGWHPHLHLLFFFRKGTPRELIEEFGRELFKRWARAVEDGGHGKCNENVYQFEPVRSGADAGGYVTKWGSEWEMLGAQGKTGKNGNKTPWQLLQEAGDGNKRSAELFVEYSKGMKGARQLTYSKGLREHYGLRQAATDHELAQEDDKQPARDSVEAEEPRTLGKLSTTVLYHLDKRGLKAALYEAVEADDRWVTVDRFLQAWNITPDIWCGEHFTDFD